MNEGKRETLYYCTPNFVATLASFVCVIVAVPGDQQRKTLSIGEWIESAKMNKYCY